MLYHRLILTSQRALLLKMILSDKLGVLYAGWSIHHTTTNGKVHFAMLNHFYLTLLLIQQFKIP